MCVIIQLFQRVNVNLSKIRMWGSSLKMYELPYVLVRIHVKPLRKYTGYLSHHNFQIKNDTSAPSKFHRILASICRWVVWSFKHNFQDILLLVFWFQKQNGIVWYLFIILTKFLNFCAVKYSFANFSWCASIQTMAGTTTWPNFDLFKSISLNSKINVWFWFYHKCRLVVSY